MVNEVEVDLEADLRRQTAHVRRSGSRTWRTSSSSVAGVDDEAELIDVAPAPVLAGFHGASDGMVVLAGVAAGVAAWRGIAAANSAAGLAHPQVDPPAASLEAFLAAGYRSRRLGELDLVYVGADRHFHRSLIAVVSAAHSVPTVALCIAVQLRRRSA